MRRDPFARQRELGGVLADQADPGAGPSRDPGAEEPELAVAQDRHPDVGPELQLLGDPERRRQRLDEDGLAILERVGDVVQVPFRDADDVGHRAVVPQDAQDRPVRAMPRPTRETGRAPVTGIVDLGGHAPARRRLTDELMSEHPPEPHVPPRQLEIGVADPHGPDVEHDLAVAGLGHDQVVPEPDRYAVAVHSAHRRRAPGNDIWRQSSVRREPIGSGETTAIRWTAERHRRSPAMRQQPFRNENVKARDIRENGGRSCGQGRAGGAYEGGSGTPGDPTLDGPSGPQPG